MIKCGKMDRLIRVLALPIFEEPGISAAVQRDINTILSNEWTVVIPSVWASFKDTTGSEVENGDVLKSERSAIFEVRYTSLILEEHYIDLDSRIWRIRSIADFGRKEGLQIVASTIALLS